MFLPIDRMWERVERSRDDGDATLLMELLYLGELVTKLTVGGMASAVADDRDRHRYRQLHRLVRADSLGEWSSSLDEILTGPTSQYIIPSAREVQKQLTERVEAGQWQYEAAALMVECVRLIDSRYEAMPTRIEGRRWFTAFGALRNRTRGHGAVSASQAGSVAVRLEQSLRLLSENSMLFSVPWAYLHRNLSGKYRVAHLTESGRSAFDSFKASSSLRVTDGVYIRFEEAVRVDLLYSNVDTTDFHLPNGNFNSKRFELISYPTGQTMDGDAVPYLPVATELPKSETEGQRVLEVRGNCFANLPPVAPDYIRRPVVERELSRLLVDDRHPIITLAGRGGIGKTSVALTVLHELTTGERFSVIAWLSARDVDLLSIGPKPVRPQVLTTEDVARDVVDLLQPAEKSAKGFRSLDYLGQLLSGSTVGPVLFVLDNFETMRVPQETFAWIDTYVRPPNKVLITTRSRDFKGDYPVDMSGMTEEECDALIDSTSSRLGISEFISTGYRRDLYRETEGHPYVVKILLGEVATARRAVKVERIVASKDDVLTALFERTYAGLSPAARRIFLTLCGWRSLVPQIGLEAVLLRKENEKLDVDEAVQELLRASLVEQYHNDDEQITFLGVPLTAAVFGRKKLTVSPMSPEIESDLQLLQAFGASRPTDVATGASTRIERLFAYVSDRVGKGGEAPDRYVPILEFLSRRYPAGWLLLARLYEESRPSDWIDLAKDAIRKYLESRPPSGEQVAAWRKLAWLCESSNDLAGEAHALVELARVEGISFGVASSAANRLNALFSGPSAGLDVQAKRVMATRVAQVMDGRSKEADATDISRLAWLYLHAKDDNAAREWIRSGLKLEPSNVHLNNLAERVGLQTQ